jgi:hypothetical protein
MAKPWNSRPAVKGTHLTENARANREKVRQMSDCELSTGMTAEQLKAFHDDQKARVLASLRREEKAA